MKRFTYKPEPIEYGGKMSYDEISKRFDRNYKHLEECDEQAREAGQLVGRYIGHGCADGEAIYQIVGETKLTVKIRVCTGLGDDWVLPAWGVECKIDKATALRFLSFRDGVRELFANKD